MEIHIRRLLYSKHSAVFISIILGFGLATMFRRACKERNCIIFRAPELNKIKNKVFKFNNNCYSYKENGVSCDTNKKIIEFA